MNGPSRLTAHLDRRPVVAYVLLTYTLSWTAFTLWSTVPESQPLLSMVLFVAGGFGPMVAAVLLLLARGASVREWFRTVFQFRVRPTAYLFALALPPLAVVLAGAVHVLAAGGTLTLGALPPLYEYPVYLLFILFLGGGQEEPGWRGYLLAALESRFSALGAALVVGVVWAVWHLPLFVFPGTIQAEMAFWLYVPQVTAISVVLTWLTHVSRESVLPAMVLHAGANAVINYYPVGGVETATSTTGYGLLTAVIVAVALALVVRYGPTLQRPVRTTTTGTVSPPSD